MKDTHRILRARGLVSSSESSPARLRKGRVLVRAVPSVALTNTDIATRGSGEWSRCPVLATLNRP